MPGSGCSGPTASHIYIMSTNGNSMCKITDSMVLQTLDHAEMSLSHRKAARKRQASPTVNRTCVAIRSLQDVSCVNAQGSAVRQMIRHVCVPCNRECNMSSHAWLERS